MGKKTAKQKKRKPNGGERQNRLKEREQNAKRLALSEEIAFGDRNFGLLRKELREKIMKMKLPLIKEDVMVARRTFERTLDNDDFKYAPVQQIRLILFITISKFVNCTDFDPKFKKRN